MNYVLTGTRLAADRWAICTASDGRVAILLETIFDRGTVSMARSSQDTAPALYGFEDVDLFQTARSFSLEAA